MSIQNKERERKSVCINVFRFERNKRLYLFFNSGNGTKKNLFTVLTEESSIPDDNDDKWGDTGSNTGNGQHGK
jgi:hypothetical protein